MVVYLRENMILLIILAVIIVIVFFVRNYKFNKRKKEIEEIFGGGNRVNKNHDK